MGYINKSKDGRWGLPAGLVALILGLVLFGGMSGPDPVHAASISCGGCHSKPPSDSDSDCLKLTSKSHPEHANGADLTTCLRCHPDVPDSTPTAVHINGVVNITSVVSPGLDYAASECTGACHMNKPAAWGGKLNCNSCHFRAGSLGSYAPSGLHVAADRSWKHYSSPIRVIDNTQVITCSNCHPMFENQTTSPRAHIASTAFAKRADMSEAFQNVTVTGIGYVKGGTQGSGICAKSCHYNAGDPFGNYTIYFKPGQKRFFGAYQSKAWNEDDLNCNECHSTPGQEATFGSPTSGVYGHATSFASKNANKRHEEHMFSYRLNPWNFQNEDRNIYCDDCHRTPDIVIARGFLHHSTIGKDNSKVISLPVRSQYSRVYMLWRNNGIGRDGVNPPGFNVQKATCSNVYCHTLMTIGGWTEEACSACHGTSDGVNVGSGAPGMDNLTTTGSYGFEEYSGGGGAHYTHVTRRGYPCRTCHYDGGGDGNPANHHDVSVTVLRANVNVGVQPDYWFNNKTSIYDTTTRSCSDVKCHYGASQNWDCDPLH